MMAPYVGARYEIAGEQSILLIGESHYLPLYSTQHQTPAGWYCGDSSTLNSEEQLWINPSMIILDSSADGFRNKAHSIYRKSFLEINQHGPKYSDYRRVGESVVFYNYFLRPAGTGQSLRVTAEDGQIAAEVFKSVLEKYCPSAVVFLSRMAYHWHARSNYHVSAPVAATPHPGCSHWNRITAKYGNKRGRDILGDLVKTMNWNSV